MAEMFGLLDKPVSKQFSASQRQGSVTQTQNAPTRARDFQSSFAGDQEGSLVGAQGRIKTPLSEMAPIDRWGLKGLLSTINSEDPATAALAAGQDLTTLGLDVNSQEFVT
jgi:hypothetical protein